MIARSALSSLSRGIAQAITLALAITIVAVGGDTRAAERPAPLAGAEQLLVVTTDGFTATTGTLWRFELRGGRWTPVGTPIAVVVGASGLGWGLGRFPRAGARPARGPVKREGDQRAPAGVFSLGEVTGYPPAPPPGTKMPYRQATRRLRCVDDTASLEYNRLALAPEAGVPPWKSDEAMLRDDELYQFTVFVEHNTGLDSRGRASGRPVPGGGSCIFLHVGAPASPPMPAVPTVGCTAMSFDDLRAVLAFLDPAKRPLLVQMPSVSYRALRGELGLPALPPLSPKSR